MNRNVVIIGTGMGGLTAAIRLARAGLSVQAVEARPEPGGLAGPFENDGFSFDAGPYILLDRPGLEWAFHALGLKFAELVPFRPIPDVYGVESPTHPPVRFLADLEATASGLEHTWPGAGKRYTDFVASVARIFNRLQPLQCRSHPGLLDLLRTGAWRHVPFLFRSLAQVLGRTGLPPPVVDALAIWTHVAGQRPEEAPSPLAFVPAVIHTVGAVYPVGGIGVIPRVLASVAKDAGVKLRFGIKVTAIQCEGGCVRGVETEGGERLDCGAVISNAGGVATYLNLVEPVPGEERERLHRLPLQSPGVCAYLAVRGDMRPPYLRFHLPGGGELCRLLVRPGVLAPELERDGWFPARLMAPMRHSDAQSGGTEGQRRHLDAVLAEEWWRRHITDYRLLASRIPAEWGSQYHLYHDSMNPVMTARFMRAGRMAHRSPFVRGLYLAGSSTHPGQWVSFCAISGILAANRLLEDFA
jgi:phytoene dehydrogenase-like protein